MANFLSPIGNGVSFIDDDGAPRAGAKLFTYDEGSTTKRTVFKNEAGSSSHTNPILLDDNGAPPSPIWITGGVGHKFVLAPSNDTDPPASPFANATWDNISGINDTSVAIDEWISAPAPTFVDVDTFTLVGDQTTDFHVNRRVKFTVSAGTVYGYISATAYTTLTTVDVVLDSGDLDSGLSAVELSLLSSSNQSYPNEIATTDTAQTITGEKTFQSSDAGAGIGPNLILDRNSATPAASDVLGSLQFKGRDSGGNAVDYARIAANIDDPTDTSEDGNLVLQTSVAGTLASRVTVKSGIQIGSPTGGDKGAGTLNSASTIYVNNAAVISQAVWSTYSPTVTLVGGAGNTVPVYTTNSGRFLQYGTIIFVDVYLTGDGGAEGAGTGQVNVLLPSACAAGHPGFSWPAGTYSNGGTLAILYGEINSTTIVLSKADLSALTGADQNNASRDIRLKFFYEV